MGFRTIAVLGLCCFAARVPLLAQGPLGGRLQVSVGAGVLRIDERGLGFSSASLDGLRYAGESEIVDVWRGIVGFEITPDFTVEVDYLRGSASLSMRAFQGDTRLPDPVLEEGDVTVDLYALRGRFSYPPRSSLQGSLFAGRGTIQLEIDVGFLENGQPVGPSGSTARGPAWELGGGLEWWSEERWGVRLEVVDHIQRCAGETHTEINICGRRGRIETLHHPSITVGASVSF